MPVLGAICIPERLRAALSFRFCRSLYYWKLAIFLPDSLSLSFLFTEKKKKSDLFVQDLIRVIGDLRSFNGVVYCSSNNL